MGIGNNEKTAVVTGGTHGIGLSIAKLLVKRGVNICVKRFIPKKYGH